MGNLTEAHIEKLTDAEVNRVDELRETIRAYYERIPIGLRHSPSSQETALEYLLDAENNLSPPITRAGIIQCKLDLTRIELEFGRARSSHWSFSIVLAIVYFFAALVFVAFKQNWLNVGAEPEYLNEQLVMGMPLPIIVWAVIGSFTSMLLRAGQLPFSNPFEAFRWLCFRPVVGIVMGMLTYLLVVAGLIVFSGQSDVRTPELLWVIAFVGAFSDTLSINLLQRVVGKFQAPEVPDTKREPT